MRDGLESLTKVKINNNRCSPLIDLASYLIIEGSQVDQPLFHLHKPMLTTPKHLPVLNVPGNGFQGWLLHHFPGDQGETAQPVVTHILLLALLGQGIGAIAFFQWLGSPSDHHDLSKIIETDNAMTSASSLSTHGWYLLSHLCMSN